MMGHGIDSGAAPPFVGQAPPRQQASTLAELLQQALNIIVADRQLSPDEFRALGIFQAELAAFAKQQVAQQAAQPQPGESPQPGDDTEDYGAHNGEPVEDSRYA